MKHFALLYVVAIAILAASLTSCKPEKEEGGVILIDDVPSPEPPPVRARVFKVVTHPDGEVEVEVTVVPMVILSPLDPVQ